MRDTVSCPFFSRGESWLIIVEFGKEKSESLVGLSDKQIEETVTGLVKTGV